MVAINASANGVINVSNASNKGFTNEFYSIKDVPQMGFRPLNFRSIELSQTIDAFATSEKKLLNVLKLFQPCVQYNFDVSKHSPTYCVLSTFSNNYVTQFSFNFVVETANSINCQNFLEPVIIICNSLFAIWRAVFVRWTGTAIRALEMRKKY